MNTLCITVFESVEYLSFPLLSNALEEMFQILNSFFNGFVLLKKFIIIIIFYYDIVYSII